MLGGEVSVLVNERMNAGVHEVTFDGSSKRSRRGDFPRLALPLRGRILPP